jgi:hypothetical protein
MEIRSTSFNFPRMRGSGPRTAEQAVVFPRAVDNAAAGIAGYSAGFRGGDHHLGILQVKLDAEVNANVVVVRATFALRDWSGSWDDDYAGTIQVAVLAELVDASLPPPRGDLQITGMEVNQAIQSFRSAEHLDADHVMPDNAVTLVGGKTTGIRIYVDHGADPALPPIASLSGEVEVRTGASTLTLAPLATIVPRRDTEIDRGSVGHTLNFAIPGAWCRGSVDIRARVFDAANPTSGSATLRRTLRFVDVNPLRVFGVGVHYTGQGMNLAAPDATTVLGTFDYARRTFPVGDVLLSGYTTLDFGDDMFTTDTTGCGDGFESLNGELKDLRGDSDDLFYGLLPTGINYGTFIGCGGDGVGSGTVGDMVTAAHEAGHAYGRKHAPCDDSTRCSNPANQDGDYPQYALFDSDSIGEFGFDPENNMVFDPATAHDFMGYSGQDWVSPYTYSALLSKGDPVQGAAMARIAYLSAKPPARTGYGRAEWSRRPAPLLFLDLRVDQDRKVTVPHVFTFPARPRLRHTRPSDFRAAIRDRDGTTRTCVRLDYHCFHCGPTCWPQHLVGEVPIDFERARELVIYEGEEQIAALGIPDRPRLDVGPVEYPDREVAVLRWRAEDPEKLVYLVHWQDEAGVWRGIAPRQQNSEIAIPPRLRTRAAPLRVRVLASNGLATAMGETSVEPLGGRRDPDKQPEVDVVIDVGAGVVIRAFAIDERGRSLPNAGFAWYDSAGGEIARGNALDLRLVPAGKRIVRAVAVNAGAGRAEREVEVVGRLPNPPRKPPRDETCERHRKPPTCD